MTNEAYVSASLEPLFEKELITDVLHVVKSGKEATVYCCAAHPTTGVELLAAKVYRPRENRTFKNDALYQHGRMLDKRLQRAISNRSRKGLEVQFSSWIEHEYSTLHLLYAAGATIPRPIAHSGSAILMEYVGDHTAPAPLLINVTPTRNEARRFFDLLMHNIQLWLSCERVHGDLSPYNILYWQGDIKIIDFPQSVHPQNNPNAFNLLAHDIETVCNYLARYGVRANPRRITEDMWVRYQFREL